VVVEGVQDCCFVKSIRYAGQEIPESGAELRSCQPLQIVLSATAGQVDGSVSDKATGEGATVALIPKEGASSAVTSSAASDAGAFQDPEFRKPSEGQAVTVTLDANGRQSVQLKVIPIQ
jgi:hypothetical protein